MLCNYDSNANNVLSFCAYLVSNNAESTELFVAIMALETTKRNNYKHLWIETDSSFVVNSFKKSCSCALKSSVSLALLSGLQASYRF